VLWFRINRWSSDPEQVLGNVNYGKALILINREDYFQAGLIIPKGSYPEIQSKGIEEFRADILRIAPYLAQRVNEIQSWEQIKILTVQINRLRKWYMPGLLCIGDAAHAMSPAGGVGINLAIQDAVAAANILAEPLKKGRVTKCTLAAIQCRREIPTRVTQGIQMLAHRGLNYAFRNPGQPIEAPWQAKAVLGIPGVNSVLGYAVGMGVKPEHVQHKPRVRLVRRIAVPAALAAVGMAATVAAVGWAAWKIWRRA
jgi:2-polyprenyl-6-methoxyphenol hydroxylase-like FAD-dependent oxidoreductase